MMYHYLFLWATKMLMALNFKEEVYNEKCKRLQKGENHAIH